MIQKAHNNGELIFTVQDDDGHVEVVDLAGLRALHFSSPAIQSLLDPQVPEKLQLDYTAVMALGMLMQSTPERILLIGLGGGALLHFIFHYFPSVKIDVIEKRPAVIEIARDYFLLPDDDRIQLYCGDAQMLLASLSENYAVIFNDAYSGNGPDIALYADEVHKQIVRLLSQDGVLVSNLWQRRIEDNLELLAGLQRCLPAMAYHKDNEGRNLVLFSARKAWSRKALTLRSLVLQRLSCLPFEQHNQKLNYGIITLRWKMRLLNWATA